MEHLPAELAEEAPPAEIGAGVCVRSRAIWGSI
jgi:hypothetical protein